MLFKDALVLGYSCGLTTDSECILNVYIHCMSMFKYDNIDAELHELDKSYVEHKASTPREMTDTRLDAMADGMKKAIKEAITRTCG